MYKLIFYVPQNEAETVKNSIFNTGAGKIGNYSHCSWETSGIGQFMPLDGANPTIGTLEKLERVQELRVEILCEDSNINEAVAALKRSHSYEEPAFEVLSILNYR